MTDEYDYEEPFTITNRYIDRFLAGTARTVRRVRRHAVPAVRHEGLPSEASSSSERFVDQQFAPGERYNRQHRTTYTQRALDRVQPDAGQHRREIIPLPSHDRRIRTGRRVRKKLPLTKLNDAIVPRGVMVLPEFKWFDTTIDVSPINVNPQNHRIQIALIPQGVSQSNRLANRAQVRKIQITGHLVVNGASHASSNFNRWAQLIAMAIVIDHQANGSLLDCADIWTTPVETERLRNLEKIKRFTVLRNLLFNYVPNLSQLNDTSMYQPDQFIPFEIYLDTDIPMKFEEGGTTVNTNNIYFIFNVHNNLKDVRMDAKVRVRFLG